MSRLSAKLTHGWNDYMITRVGNWYIGQPYCKKIGIVKKLEFMKKFEFLQKNLLSSLTKPCIRFANKVNERKS